LADAFGGLRSANHLLQSPSTEVEGNFRTAKQPGDCECCRSRNSPDVIAAELAPQFVQANLLDGGFQSAKGVPDSADDAPLPVEQGVLPRQLVDSRHLVQKAISADE
jgi:hypothetical protein